MYDVSNHRAPDLLTDNKQIISLSDIFISPLEDMYVRSSSTTRVRP